MKHIDVFIVNYTIQDFQQIAFSIKADYRALVFEVLDRAFVYFCFNGFEDIRFGKSMLERRRMEMYLVRLFLPSLSFLHEYHLLQVLSIHGILSSLSLVGISAASAVAVVMADRIALIILR